MEKEEFFRQYAGRYRLVRMVIRGNDVSQTYENGWKDKSLYLFIEITAEGGFSLTAHAGGADKQYPYFFEPEEMKYYLSADHSDKGTAITIENGVLTEETEDHLMVYELTEDLG